MRMLYKLVEELGVELVYTDLPPEYNGLYDRATHAVYVQEGLAYRLHRHTLAHELGHAYYGDAPSPFGPVNWKQERRANEWAALRLIQREAYKRAELIRGGHVGAMAYELGVIDKTVVAYQRTLQRIGGTVYQHAGMGAGNWSHREQVA